MTGPQGATRRSAFAEKVNAALDDIRGLDPKVVLQVPSGSRSPSKRRRTHEVAALGPIPSEDGAAVLFNVVLVGDSDQTATIVEDLNTIRDRYTTGDMQFYMLGEPTSTDDFKKISEEDLRKGEFFGIAAAIIVLLVVFSFAGVTPIIMGIFAIGVAMGLVGVFGQVWRFSFFV